jgi:hypothetical protein
LNIVVPAPPLRQIFEREYDDSPQPARHRPPSVDNIVTFKTQVRYIAPVVYQFFHDPVPPAHGPMLQVSETLSPRMTPFTQATGPQIYRGRSLFTYAHVSPSQYIWPALPQHADTSRI